MATNNFFRSDLPKIHHVVQNSMIVYPKEIIIATLKDYFQHDSYYHYVKDAWGFANTVDQTDLPLEAGYQDNISTRLFIGENFRYDGIFYPAILVKHGGARSVPISINREDTTVDWGVRPFDDGYGNIIYFKNPQALNFAGAWEGSIVIDVLTRSLRSRDDLVQEVAMCFTDITFKSLHKAGVICKPLSISAPSELEDRNDKLFKQSITIDIRTEWRRRIPVTNVVESINFAIEFADLGSKNPVVAQNLTVNTNVNVSDIMIE